MITMCHEVNQLLNVWIVGVVCPIFIKVWTYMNQTPSGVALQEFKYKGKAQMWPRPLTGVVTHKSL